jgi:hypothetical protein
VAPADVQQLLVVLTGTGETVGSVEQQVKVLAKQGEGEAQKAVGQRQGSHRTPK